MPSSCNDRNGFVVEEVTAMTVENSGGAEGGTKEMEHLA